MITRFDVATELSLFPTGITAATRHAIQLQCGRSSRPRGQRHAPSAMLGRHGWCVVSSFLTWISLLLSAGDAHAQFGRDWVVGNGSWNTPSNWSPPGPPTADEFGV